MSTADLRTSDPVAGSVLGAPGVTAARRVRLLGVLVMIAGAILALAGAITYAGVSTTLSQEKITVAEDASFLAGNGVNGPFSAYAQADIIKHHALAATDGQTYAQLDREDPRRTTVMTGSFLRASLFTSVLAFGVSALAVGLGVVFVLIGLALAAVARSLRAQAMTAGA